MKKVLSGMMLTLLLTGILMFAFNIQPVKSEPKTWIVDDDGPADFHTIQEAINAANPGDIIYVCSGYYSGCVGINKQIVLIGEDVKTTVISGTGRAPTISVNSPSVTLSNFTVIGGGNTGIEVYRQANCSIINNIVTNSSGGILISDSSDNFLFNNTIQKSDYGIKIDSSYNNTLQFNKIVDNLYGFEVFGLTEEHFVQNIDTSNSVNGKPIYYLMNQRNITILPKEYLQIGYLALVNCTFVTVKNMNITQSLQGILVVSTNNSIIEDLTLVSNLRGMFILHSHHNKILNNNILSTWRGIYIINSSDNIVAGNLISVTDWTVGLAHSNNNHIYHNNFINYTRSIMLHSLFPSTGNIWDDGYPSGGNYWSDYNGTDLYGGQYQNETGGDGIGDTPYIIDANNVDHYPLMRPWVPSINATVDIIPNTLNLRGRPQYVTAYIELPEGYNVSNIEVSSILLNDTIPVDLNAPTAIGDYENDTIPDLMVKFDGTEVMNYILNNVNMTELFEQRFLTVTLTITGRLNNGVQFQGTDTIRIMMPMPGGFRRHIFPI